MMRIPSAAELLMVWELGLPLAPPERGLLLLRLLFPAVSDAALAQLSIGARDGHLLALRGALFGDQLASIADCPHCGERLELNLALAQLRAPVLAQPGDRQEVEVVAEGYRLRCRLPNSADLIALLTLAEPAAARQTMFQRCVLAVEAINRDLAPPQQTDLPERVIATVIAQMAEADPQANLQLALTCPNCSHNWLLPLDVLAYLWSEISDWAHRLLREVHTLAWAYGWAEAEILAMSAQRRQSYLQLLGA